MKITSVESFKVEIPISEEQQKLRYYHKTAVTRIRTDEGITGYGWSEIDADAASGLLLGKDPIQVERLVADGLGHDFFGAKNALWDIVGKMAGLPIYTLLGGSVHEEIPLYADHGIFDGAESWEETMPWGCRPRAWRRGRDLAHGFVL